VPHEQKTCTKNYCYHHHHHHHISCVVSVTDLMMCVCASILLFKNQIIIIIIYIYHLYAMYLQLYTWKKPCVYGIHCCSCSVFTICATCNVISCQKYNVLSSQNTTVFKKWYMEYFVLSTTCFGLYIGHHQVSIKLIKRLYNLYGVLWGGGGAFQCVST